MELDFLNGGGLTLLRPFSKGRIFGCKEKIWLNLNTYRVAHMFRYCKTEIIKSNELQCISTLGNSSCFTILEIFEKRSFSCHLIENQNSSLEDVLCNPMNKYFFKKGKFLKCLLCTDHEIVVFGTKTRLVICWLKNKSKSIT